MHLYHKMFITKQLTGAYMKKNAPITFMLILAITVALVIMFTRNASAERSPTDVIIGVAEGIGTATVCGHSEYSIDFAKAALRHYIAENVPEESVDEVTGVAGNIVIDQIRNLTITPEGCRNHAIDWYSVFPAKKPTQKTSN